MEAKCYDELQSFLSKFTFLCVHGVNATLNVNSFLGNVYVNLNADLGPTHPLVIPHDQEEFRPYPHVKPSRLRRRKRRQRKRAIAKEFIDAHDNSVMKDDACDTVTCDEVESSIEDGHTLLDDSRSLSDQTPIMANTSDAVIQFDNSSATSSSCIANIDSKCWDQVSLMSKSMSSSIENSFSATTSSSISGILNGIKPSHGPVLKKLNSKIETFRGIP